MLYDAARSDMEHAIALDANSYQAHFLLGNVLLTTGSADLAASEYRIAVQLQPDQPRTYYQLALIARTKGDEAGESHLLQQALTADSHYAPAHCELGRLLMGQHRLPEAVDHLNLAVQYNPRIEQGYYLLARAYAVLGGRQKSDAMLKRFTEVRSANRRSHPDQRPDQLGATANAHP